MPTYRGEYMTFEFTYKELSKKLGCTELTVRHWLSHYKCEIIPGKRGRNGDEAKVRITEATIKAIVVDSINYSQEGRKPFSNFALAEWNTIEKVECELSKAHKKLYDKFYNEYIVLTEDTPKEYNETVYFVNDEKVIFKITPTENDAGVYNFVPVYDTGIQKFTGKFNRVTLIDELNRKWTPVMIHNSKFEWITMPKKMAKLLKKTNKSNE